MNNSARPADIRRRVYSYSLHTADYFVLKNLRRYLKKAIDEYVSAGTNVADIGCGEQPLRHWIESSGGTYTGIDIQQNSQGSVNIVSSIYEIPMGNNTYDLVLCTEVLEHVQKFDIAMEELIRIVKPGGIIIITAPFLYPLHEEPNDYWRITPYAIKSCAASKGLEVVRLEAMGNELEAIATIWCNLWSRATIIQNVAWKYLRKLMRTPVNIFVLSLSGVLNSCLPKKLFLHTVAELRKSIS